jgi:hypothetical protein
MKTKENFTLRCIAGTTAVLPLGDATLDFTGLLTLNESGVLLWGLLEKGCTKEDLADALVQEYEVAYEAALADVQEFLEKLLAVGCIDLDA